ncbi:hypothetical protein SO802_014077 [Lithocarpus litseifolius]|uniref:Uncharacterized protein n=1 Tax=Lithocarpus litseifolius TaxID=425828 RepID=A0AAW2DCX2_9ROSI
MDASERNKLSDKIRWFARYPDNEAKQFKRYVINGLKFCTKDFETTRKLKIVEFVLLLKVVLLIMMMMKKWIHIWRIPYNITTEDTCDDANDNHAWARVDEEETIYDTPLISEDELLEQDFIDDEELGDDVYESNDDESNDDGSKDKVSSDDDFSGDDSS